ncbi:hypothetical protein [Methylosinus sp. PW1]|nr:hypothetical protein [Methylosinus sp. PW1]
MPPDDRDALLLIVASACAAFAAIYLVKLLPAILYAARWGVPE